MIKAIETQYKGYRFRSRLEARWAVFFDSLDLKWEYEKEGFDLGKAGNYLPDFWLTDQLCWLEVKGQKATEDEHEKAASLARMTERPVIIASGNIGPSVMGECGCPEHSYEARVHYGSSSLAAKHIFHLWEEWPEDHQCSQISCWPVPYDHHEHIINLLQFVHERGMRVGPILGVMSLVEEVILADQKYFLGKYGREHPRWKYGWPDLTEMHISAFDRRSNWLTLAQGDYFKEGSEIKDALIAARSARFEHGENGAPR